jgi:K+-sensing histidine kinase KdpD
MTPEGSEFYAALIHELKNELCLLSMTLERIPLQGEATHDDAVDGARLLCQGVVERLHQALLMYKTSGQPIRPSIDAYSPHELVQHMQARAMGLARGRFRIETRVTGVVPDLWFFDRELVEMALINAIHNALAHARSTIRIEADLQQGCLSLCVRDDSTGYPAHILDPALPKTAPSTTGTGLGLQFARLIAERHDNQGRRGALCLTNEGGAVFRLLLP